MAEATFVKADDYAISLLKLMACLPAGDAASPAVQDAYIAA